MSHVKAAALAYVGDLESEVDQDIRCRLDRCPVVQLPVDSVLPADSPRSCGEDIEHASSLADCESALPPIIVHEPTRRVIDGMHRLCAAIMRGDRLIAAKLFDGDEHDAFVLSVRLNVTHGLPLTRADRQAAAARIVNSHPVWSDRMIAAMAGLATSVVAEIRRCSTDRSVQSDRRLGRDGRARPINGTLGRLRASKLIAENPGASLRAIAKEAGVSPSTVQDVRRRMEAGEDPVPPPRQSGQQLRQPAPAPRVDVLPADELATAVANLRTDPVLRFSERGRSLLRWLGAHVSSMSAWGQIVDSVPVHCAPTMATILRGYAMAWSQLAQQIEERAEAE